MIRNSVVGKVWITIIGLVSVVLIVLVVLLNQSLEQFYKQQQQQSLTRLARDLTAMVESYDRSDHMTDRRHVLEMVKQLLPAYDTRMLVLTVENGIKSEMPLPPQNGGTEVSVGELLTASDFQQVLRGKEIKGRRTIDAKNGQERSRSSEEVFVVGEPLYNRSGDVGGAIVLYQPLSQLMEAAKKTKQLVFYSALIGIFLATIFAFFLSSRITQPLVQMNRAADKIVKGNFNYRVPIRTHDEIGDLAKTFNRMGSQLEETIRALSHEKEQLASVLKSIADAVITFDVTGRIIITNPPAETLLKVWSSSLSNSGGKHNHLVPEPLKDALSKVVKKEEEYATDLLVLGRTWAVVMSPLYAGEQVRGAVAVLRDVTEERRMDKLRKDFVANVSHELRTPLAMLQGYSEALMDDIAQSPEDRKELAQIIHDESLRMSRLVTELLDLALMESGSIKIKPKRVNLQEYSRRIARKFQFLADEKGLTIKTAFPNTPLYAAIDEDRMEQVFTNLVENAIRHTPSGGKITLELEQTDEGVVFKVGDTGSGIPDQDLPFIFERFYKADRARTRKNAGTGLGLPIAKHIVEEHGGMISVESREGKGTVFSIRLPDQNVRNMTDSNT